jgi:hypothetical protein
MSAVTDPIVDTPLDITITVISHNHRDMLSDCLRDHSLARTYRSEDLER